MKAGLAEKPDRGRRYKDMQHGHSDHFQTPPYAIDPLLPYLRKEWRIWEPSAGSGLMVSALEAAGHCVIGTDIMRGIDFLTGSNLFDEAPHYYDAIITNPPYSCKDAYIARCYELRKPFALLLPITALEGQHRQSLYRRHGLEVIFMDRRVNFVTPSGNGGGSWFSTAWFTHGLGIGQQMTFAQLPMRRGMEHEANGDDSKETA